MITLHRSKNKQYYFRVVSPRNGQVIATSETYTRKRSAVSGISSLCRLVGSTKRFIDKTKGK